MLYFHASPVKGIKILQPQSSDNNEPLIYFSTKRENVLVYLSNAVEKYCRETGFEHVEKFTKWGPYGFDKNGNLCIHEYYPNALIDTYKGVSSYIYSVEDIPNLKKIYIPDAFASINPVPVQNCEFVADAYEAIIAASNAGLISLLRYEQNSQSQLDWIKKTMREQYKNAQDQPDYRHFLEGKFPFVKE